MKAMDRDRLLGMKPRQLLLSRAVVSLLPEISSSFTSSWFTQKAQKFAGTHFDRWSLISRLFATTKKASTMTACAGGAMTLDRYIYIRSRLGGMSRGCVVRSLLNGIGYGVDLRKIPLSSWVGWCVVEAFKPLVAGKSSLLSHENANQQSATHTCSIRNVRPVSHVTFTVKQYGTLFSRAFTRHGLRNICAWGLAGA